MTKRTSRRVAVQWMAVLAAASFMVSCAQPTSRLPTGVPSTSARSTSLPTVGVPIASTPIPSAIPTDTPITSVIPTDTPTTTATATDAPTARPASDAQLASRIDSFLAGLATQDRFSGSVLVAKDGQVVLSEGYNLADREQALANTPQTVFRLGSVTKQFTAMAILQLQQMGKLERTGSNLPIHPRLSCRLATDHDPSTAHPHLWHSRIDRAAHLSRFQEAACDPSRDDRSVP